MRRNQYQSCRPWIIGALASLVLLVVGGQAISAETGVTAERTGPVVAIFRADWCPKCKLLEPRLQTIAAAYEQRGMRFVVFDLTNRRTKNAARLAAANAHILDAYDRHATKPGFAVVIPAGSRPFCQSS